MQKKSLKVKISLSVSVPKVTNPLSGPVCPEGTLQCSDNQTCISTKTQCDGRKHCPDGGDEDEEFCKGRF